MNRNSVEDSPRICIVGAGVGGVCAGIQLQRLLNINSFTIYDNQEDVGGVWRANRYPGCANDVPSIFYSYSFALKGDWSRSFASSEEFCQYLRDLSIKYELYPRMKFRTEVKSLIWEEKLQKWNVTVSNKVNNFERSEESILYDIVIIATGHFHKPYYPPEFLKFKGPLVHTAEWDQSIDLENKDVAIIGSGASAMQLISNIVEKVKNLYSYQRRPVWNLYHFRPDFEIPRAVKFIFTYLPFVVWVLRFILHLLFELFILLYRTDLKFGRRSQEFYTNAMKGEIPDEKLRNDLTPNYSIGCKRICANTDYFPAMMKPHVKLFRNDIAEVTEDSVITKDGTKTKIDILVLATGFEVQKYFAPLEIIGQNGENILETWQKFAPSSYFGVVSHKMPNLFMLQGPHADSASVSANVMIEMQVRFAFRILSEMLKKNSSSFSVKAEAEEKFMKDYRSWFKNKIQMQENCHSYYNNSKNETTTYWPLTATSYWLKTRFVNFNNFEFSALKNN